jgi:Zn-dependent protease
MSMISGAEAVVVSIVVLVASVIAHELSHGVVAARLGDPTARLAGRLTLNPLKHLDPFGSVLLPLALVLSTNGSFVFGWAKPVPYDPRFLRGGNWGPAIVGAAGPCANLAIAAAFGTVLRWGATEGILEHRLLSLLAVVVMVNLVLAVFNLIPIPPLDGSKLLYAALPRHYAPAFARFEAYGFVVVMGLVYFFGSEVLGRPVMLLFRWITGIG